jgi:nucleotide-binding universal stress UspA family protein
MTTVAWKFLAIADDSDEAPTAVMLAGLRARAVGAGLVILCVVEPRAFSQWIAVSAEMLRQSRQEAEALAAGLAARVKAETGITAEIVVREGETRSEIQRLLDDDLAIKVLVLGAGSGRGGPGPLVSSLARGVKFSNRPVPVLVVPGAMTLAELQAIT